jgi:hypothetical protein
VVLERIRTYELNDGGKWLLKCLAVAMPPVIAAIVLPPNKWFTYAGCTLLAAAGVTIFSTLIGQDQTRFERHTTAGVVMTFIGMAIIFW